MSESTQSALELRGIVKRFGGVAAVEDVSLAVAPGEVLALIGENGAGKSTLIQIACGLYRSDAGEVRMNGALLPAGEPSAAIAAGLGVVYQHFMLVGPLTVWENVVLGREPRRRGVGAALGLVDRDRARGEVADCAKRAGLAIDVDAPAESLSVAAQQRVEIIKQLWRGARVLILDEPTAVLSSSEADELLRTVRGLAAEGRGVIFISHKLREVLRVADRVAVLRRGRLVMTAQATETTAEALAEAVLGAAARSAEGKAVLGVAPTRAATTDARAPSPGAAAELIGRPPNLLQEADTKSAPRLVARDLVCTDNRGRPALRGLNLELRAGEILGIAGVDGNGQTELAEVLTGLRNCAGALLLDGEDGLAPHGWARDPALARARGVVHLPADRHRLALCGLLSLEENLSLGHQREEPWAHGMFIDRAGRRARANELLAAFDVRPADPLARAGDLSGGNQQKLVAARELSDLRARLVIAVQPSRGLDFHATSRVHSALTAARDAGAAVLVVSLDLDELRALADRIAVLYEGRVAGLCAPDASDAVLGPLMLGNTSAAATIAQTGAQQGRAQTEASRG